MFEDEDLIEGKGQLKRQQEIRLVQLQGLYSMALSAY